MRFQNEFGKWLNKLLKNHGILCRNIALAYLGIWQRLWMINISVRRSLLNLIRNWWIGQWNLLGGILIILRDMMWDIVLKAVGGLIRLCMIRFRGCLEEGKGRAMINGMEINLYFKNFLMGCSNWNQLLGCYLIGLESII